MPAFPDPIYGHSMLLLLLFYLQLIDSLSHFITLDVPANSLSHK